MKDFVDGFPGAVNFFYSKEGDGYTVKSANMFTLGFIWKGSRGETVIMPHGNVITQNELKEILAFMEKLEDAC